MKLKVSLYLLAVCVAAGLLGCGAMSSNPGTSSSTTSSSTTSGPGGSSGMGSGSGSSSGSGSGTGNSGSGSGSGSTGSGSGGSSSGGSGTGSGSGSGGSGSGQRVSAFAYVGTTRGSTAGLTGGIFGFAVMPDGTATPVPGSPTSGPNSYVLTNSAFVFATDGSNIASYTRGSDGSLTASSSVVAVPNAGTPRSYGINEMSLDHTGQTLYASESAGSDNIFYFFFDAANGMATNIGQTGPTVVYGSPLVFSPDNVYAYGFGCFHLGASITAFHRNSDGSLSPFLINDGMPTYAGSQPDYCPETEAVSAMGYLAVADGVLPTFTTSGLGIYKINSDGTISLVQSSVQQTALSQIDSLNFDPTGTFLAAAGIGGIQMFQLMPGGGLSALGGAQSTGSNYLGVEWDTQNHVYAISSAGLTVFTNAGGTLTPASDSPHAAGAARSLVVLPVQ